MQSSSRLKNERPRLRACVLWLQSQQIGLLLGLTLLWMMLWQEVTLLSVVSGLVLAFAVTRIFYLPPFESSGRLNLIAVVKYLIFFIYELFLGSLQVALVALNFTKKPKTAVIAVNLRTHNDFLLTMTALTVSLIPGSLIADVDRFNSVLYLHVLHAPTKAEQDKVRRLVLQIERLLIDAIGSRAEVEALHESA